MPLKFSCFTSFIQGLSKGLQACCFLRLRRYSPVSDRLCAKSGSRVISKMARERASSGLPMMDDSLFVGPRIPDEIKRMIPHLTGIDKFLFRKILQGNLA